jgi:DNA-binding HxlR family transcriptional regulator
MKSYGQFCPVAKAAELFCERWTPLILRDLSTGVSRFSELRRGVPLASPTLLSRRLKQLEAEGVVERRRVPGSRHTAYHLTPAGAEFAPLVEALGVWGQRWARRELQRHEADLGLLIWALQRSVRPEAFGQARTTVELRFPEQPKAKQRWWFVNEGRAADLCLDNPGYEVDLYLTVSLADMILIWRGDLPLRRAIDQGRLQADGGAAARRALPRWLGVSTLAHVASQRPYARAA